LWLWPLEDDRRSVGKPVEVLDCNKVLGPAKTQPDATPDNRWHADHPMCGVFTPGGRPASQAAELPHD